MFCINSHWGTLCFDGSLQSPGAPLYKFCPPLVDLSCVFLLVTYEGIFPGGPLHREACEAPVGMCGTSPGPLYIMWGSGDVVALKEPAKKEARISINGGSCNGGMQDGPTITIFLVSIFLVDERH